MHTDLLERHLPRLLDDLADERTPAYYDDLFWQTAHTSQRPAWTLRERWFPMLQIARQPVVAQPPWRAIGVLLLLIAALAAGLVLAGARQKLPPATGPAANGLVAFSRDGEILTYDPRTGVTGVLVTGPDVDTDPIWSQDGTRLLFRREVSTGRDAALLMTARANGTGVTQVTPDVMSGISWYEISPDGRTVVLIADVKGIPALFVADTDGKAITRLDIGGIPMSASLDPTGTKILIIDAQGVDGSYSGLSVIGVDGSDRRRLIEPRVDAPFAQKARWSPDGTRIAYSRWEPAALKKDARVHVMDADGTGDVIVGHQDGTWYEAFHAWSPDGASMSIERSGRNASDTLFRPVIIAVDGGKPDVIPDFESRVLWLDVWSPDGTAILVRPADDDGLALQQQLWDPRTGAVHTTPWSATSYPAWQRIAP